MNTLNKDTDYGFGWTIGLSAPIYGFGVFKNSFMESKLSCGFGYNIYYKVKL